MRSTKSSRTADVPVCDRTFGPDRWQLPVRRPHHGRCFFALDACFDSRSGRKGTPFRAITRLMWTRIYVGVLAAGVLVGGGFTYYASSWLTSIGRPEDAIAGYEHTSSIAWTMLSLCSIVLLFLGCGVMWSRGKAWGLWVTFAYFAVFVALSGFYLDRGYQQLVEATAGIDTKVWGTPVISVLIIAGAAIPVLALQYLVVVLRQKFHRSDDQPTIDLDAENESSRPM